MSEKILDRFKLDGKTALVTGGGQGIGQAYCFALGQAGAKVAVVDINLQTAEETAAALGKEGITAIAIKTDVTNETDVENMVKTVVDKWGTLTIGVNNAGMGVWRAALVQEFSEWRKILALNLDSIFLCARHEARLMEKTGYGKIINTA
jgi:NAD(P)-dependent dehydrogenase (short-subunit alcohol dehydrogenase family)